MSKTKQKNHSELEHLRGENKRLKSINRQLRKKLKEFERKEHFFENIVEDVVDSSKGSIDFEMCVECGKGIVHEIDLNYLIIKKCDICSHTERIRHGENYKKKT